MVPSELEEPLTFAGTLVDEGDRFGGKMSPATASDYIVPARFIHHDFGYDADVIANLIVNKNSEELLQYLRVINPRVAAIAADGETGHLDIGLDKMLPMNMFGSGMIRAVAIISLCIMNSQRILLIDEIDNGLHYEAIPSLLAALLMLCRKRNIQVFATTHSLELRFSPACEMYCSAESLRTIATAFVATLCRETRMTWCGLIATDTPTLTTALTTRWRSGDRCQMACPRC